MQIQIFLGLGVAAETVILLGIFRLRTGKGNLGISTGQQNRASKSLHFSLLIDGNFLKHANLK